jgi:hypothetical protein
MGAKLDGAMTSLQYTLAWENDHAFERGMHYPVRWDQFFNDYMTLDDVYRYPGAHFDFPSV